MDFGEQTPPPAGLFSTREAMRPGTSFRQSFGHVLRGLTSLQLEMQCYLDDGFDGFPPRLGIESWLKEAVNLRSLGLDFRNPNPMMIEYTYYPLRKFGFENRACLPNLKGIKLSGFSATAQNLREAFGWRQLHFLYLLSVYNELEDGTKCDTFREQDFMTLMPIIAAIPCVQGSLDGEGAWGMVGEYNLASQKHNFLKHPDRYHPFMMGVALKLPTWADGGFMEPETESPWDPDIIP
ncbi:hypothetical protein MMC25_004002 [Agyrium rufum]|nr:hypothetical protein [Agyrium rufum]